jgi:hypothetical protein
VAIWVAAPFDEVRHPFGSDVEMACLLALFAVALGVLAVLSLRRPGSRSEEVRGER